MAKSELALANEMQQQLTARYGPLLGGSALHRALGFSSAAAMRQAAIRNQVGVRLFNITNRRGKFAWTKDVAQWLATCPADAETSAELLKVEAARPAGESGAAAALTSQPVREDASCS